MAYDGNYIKDLDPSLPEPTALTEEEVVTEWDDAIREIKRCTKNEFPNITGPVERTQAELNRLTLNESQQKLILRTGGKMAGPLVSAGDPVADLDYVNKQWVDNLFAVAPSNPSAPDYPQGFVSLAEIPRTTLTLNTTYTATNESGEIPAKWILLLHCVTAEHGYEPGDVLKVGGAQSNDTNNNLETGGIQMYANSSEIGIQTGANVWIISKASKVFVPVTPFRWEIQAIAIEIAQSPAFSEFIRSPCTLSPYNSGEIAYNEWWDPNGAIEVSANGNKWDLTDNSNTLYGTLKQTCTVDSIDEAGSRLRRVEFTVDKDLSATGFIALGIESFVTYTLGGSNPSKANDYLSFFDQTNGDTQELIGSGGTTNYVEDLGSQYKFIMEVGIVKAATVIVVTFRPAAGNPFGFLDPAATGTSTIECINGYLSGYNE